MVRYTIFAVRIVPMNLKESMQLDKIIIKNLVNSCCKEDMPRKLNYIWLFSS